MRKRWKLIISCLLLFQYVNAQESFPVNGINDKRSGCYAFVNATIVKNAAGKLANASMVIRDGKIVAVGNNIDIPKDAVIVDCSGKFIYPSFIDLYSDYGLPAPQRPTGAFNFFAPAQLTNNQKGAYGWNQALRTDVDAYKLFTVDETKAKSLRDMGFGTVLTHQKDGIARGTGTVVTLAGDKENLTILKDKASAHFSFSKGSSTQSYPGSLMGSIALLRQTYLDAQWYKTKPATEGLNISLQAFNDQLSLPQIFEANDKWNVLRADKIGDEFGVQYIIKAGGNEYQRLNEMAATKAAFILPLNFPQAMDVEDANDVRFISLSDLKHWELAPTAPAAFEKAKIKFALTAADLRDNRQFLSNLRKAIEYGLSDSAALAALTSVPAALAGIDDKTGSLDAGKLANFIITSGPVFNEKTVILQNWVQGKKFAVKEDSWSPVSGIYTLTVSAPSSSKTYSLEIKNNKASVIAKDTVDVKYSYDGKMVKLVFGETRKSRSQIRLSGVSNQNSWQGTGLDTAGNNVYWTAVLQKNVEAKDSSKRKPQQQLGTINYPFGSYGWEQKPQQQTILFKNATVWTSEKEGRLENTDVLVKNGKIVQIGKNLSDPSAKTIDATGKHLTAGIIDEHSHIAVASINEGGQTVSAEVRIGDNLNPDDINIYRQLSGGVTSSHILHGSANTIGGQTQLIKLRWGLNDDEIKFESADPFIKFALGENVKRTPATANNRYPDTRMGVEQVLTDAFQRAKEYEQLWKDYEAAVKRKDKSAVAPRRDLELDALVEIMNKKRFITCHSYVQSEINAAMKVAEKYGFTFNTFTHILEGYKVADKMKQHGANASTFSDWWIYKNEVIDAIPANASIMQRVGLNVAINSDDAEMARRLNQEAAKSIKYAGMSEEDALNMVTINPAKMLHVDKRVGSIKVGKDADIVLWNNHPLSIYAKPEKTMVDGIIYFDTEKDAEMRKTIAAERNRIINKMLGEKRMGAPVQPAQASMEIINFCDDDHGHNKGILIVNGEETF